MATDPARLNTDAHTAFTYRQVVSYIVSFPVVFPFLVVSFDATLRGISHLISLATIFHAVCPVRDRNVSLNFLNQISVASSLSLEF